MVRDTERTAFVWERRDCDEFVRWVAAVAQARGVPAVLRAMAPYHPWHPSLSALTHFPS